MSASLNGMRGGVPSTTQPIAGPWLSPKVVTRKRWPKVLNDLEHFPEKWKPVFRRKCDQLKQLCKVNDDLDVALAMLERLAPTLERDAARDQPRKPALVRAGERVGRHL